MMICEYCRARFRGSVEDAYAQGWGHLRFQHNRNGRIINHCPVHKDDAFKEMLSVVLKVLTNQPNQGSQYEVHNIRP